MKVQRSERQAAADEGAAVRPRVLKSTDAAVAAVRALLPAIAERAAEVDGACAVSQATIRELEQAGLFGILTPRALGGSALGWEAFVRVVIEIGSVCGSTAWVYGVLNGHNHLLTRFPEQMQRRILSDPTAHIAVVFRLTDAWNATPVAGGYSLSGGQGRFCSGIDHSKWVAINAVIAEGPNAGQLAFAMIEQERVPTLSDWDVLGMRGTQSRSIMIDAVDVPEENLILAMDLAGPPVGPAADELAEGAGFFDWPYFALAPFAIVGAPLGVARGMIDEAAKGLKGRIARFDDEMIAGQAASFYRLSHAAQDIEMAIELILADARRIDAGQFADSSMLEQARFRRNLAGSPQQARTAANRLFEAAGGSGIYAAHPIQRMMRDINAGAAHYAFTDDTAAANYGRALLELPPARTLAFV